jgi:putative transposase
VHFDVLRSISFAVRVISRYVERNIITDNKTCYRRRLPHIQPPEAIFFVTFRLINSLPGHVILRLLEERERREELVKAEKNFKKRKTMLEEERQRYFGHFDEYLDRVKESPKWLAEPEIAKIVVDAIKYQDEKQYLLDAFCVLPNHVHMLIDMKRNSVSL